jgi:very-short-patch-repair endonuclease
MPTGLSRKLRNNATLAERRLWRVLRGLREAGWHFRRQVAIEPYFADFACNYAKVVVEVDRDTHDFAAVAAADSDRDDYLQWCGFTVVRVTNDDVLNNPGVLLHLSGVLDAQRSSNTPTPIPSPQWGGEGPTEKTVV